MTFPQARSHGKTLPSEANSVATEKRAANASRSRASARRRETILDAALAVAAAGGYEAVQMRTVAERVGIAVGTLYRYFPAKTHLLVAALTREFRRLDSAGDWASGEGPPLQRLERLTAHLHDRWQRDPRLTTAMTRAFAVADTRAAAELDRAADEIQILLARTLRGGEPTPTDLHVAGVISDIWLANLVAFSGHRATAADTRERIDRATRRVVTSAARPTANR
ncbi:MAG TPA: TetR family transcriptional regulator [Mycobacterium sp.]|jgi:AcrR family transcriptional regulator|uniref:HTH-type transcriptional repressor KstR n=1 Tax=Mycolicibacterium poriferae TaxID=39694 RepID=A0A6N4V737_9MYCO|nr:MULTISPECIES: TetR family transcriptional regulator [Mycolicibacterium]MCB1289701.1 TetR family transcriptional regulator [Mycobacterium sp.]QFS89405.1 HTH-type transcriptional repressor KstR [Mycobacterium sp. THAF192]MCG7582404.1 TetR family transcriptional regulator [Mycolicibacterium sp. OfavD-34-C]MCV7264034.1 TetR/AcrR family transcriptional regulator [Mycolicibacterium poriferae]BBX49828.1 HTH-type transcriptional repressor KstR [Mycolicibacterium poriferae]